jgi:transcriptional regulator with XRE-family HTH domain
MAELLSDRLKRWRLGKKLLLKEAAARLDLPYGTYRKYENGKRTPPRLARAEIDRRISANGG